MQAIFEKSRQRKFSLSREKRLPVISSEAKKTFQHASYLSGRPIDQGKYAPC